MMMDLAFEDVEIAVQVLKATVPQLTRRQLECSYLLAFGLTQEQVGEVLGVSQPMVCVHFQAHLKKLREIAAEIL
jgi:DNA-binding CsgD family transcriptional regulator